MSTDWAELHELDSSDFKKFTKILPNFDEVDLTEEEYREGGYGPEKGDEDLLWTRFFTQIEKSAHASKVAKKPVFHKFLCIEVASFSKSTKKPTTFVTRIDESNRSYWIARFPSEWKQFKENGERQVEFNARQTLISQLPFLSATEIQVLKLLKISTVLELSEADATLLKDVEPALPSKIELAKQFIEAFEKRTKK
jgi:hypothetical protein